MELSWELFLALVGTVLFVVYFFKPDYRLAAGGGTALGLALIAAWAIAG